MLTKEYLFDIMLLEQKFGTYIPNIRAEDAALKSTPFLLRYNLMRERKILLNKRRRNAQLKRRITIGAFSLTILLILTAGLFTIRTSAQESSKDNLYKYYKSITVAPGDSISAYAEVYAIPGYHDNYVKEVMRMNQLFTDEINAGMSLIIPYYSTEFLE